MKAYHLIQTWFPFIFGCSKNWYIHCKTMFTLGPMAQATLILIMWQVLSIFTRFNCHTKKAHSKKQQTKKGFKIYFIKLSNPNNL